MPQSKSMDLLCYSFLLLMCAMSHHNLAASSAGVLAPGKFLSVNQTLESESGTFALGFFNPANVSDGNNNLYLGIWYNKLPKETVVWVANRKKPLTDPGAILIMTTERNLALINSSGSSVWSTEVPSVPQGTVATLLDSGNLVLSHENVTVWQSFAYPTDTYLPGMKLSYNGKSKTGQKLVAWRNISDPYPGNISAGLSSSEFILWRGSEIIWTTGALVEGFGGERLPGKTLISLKSESDGDTLTVSYITSFGSTPVRIAVEPSGEIKLLVFLEGQNDWQLSLHKPSGFCDKYGRCGAWGACNATLQTCKCPKGFDPKNETQWGNNDFSGGCVRKDQLRFTDSDTFLQVENTKLPGGFHAIERRNETECHTECLSNNQCTAYAFANQSLSRSTSTCLVWEGDLTDLQDLESGGGNLKIRLVASEREKDDKLARFLLPALLSVGVLFLGAILYFILKKNRLPGKMKAREINKLKFLEFSDTFRSDGELYDVQLVDFESIKACTSGFSEENKLGKGGFGAVYKGALASGQKVAVKRLSRASEQGQREFATEVRLIAKLQHKNLVRLLGWCMHEEEKILIYEYMLNKSLDKHIFGKSSKLCWEKRFSIIEGIADGLLYLHQHSRMRVIHRDLKTSNILLESEMNPRISDFGLAKIIEITETKGKTRKVVGTLGYMSPEYALQGVFSEKSDVFSFGVIMLEVMTGKRSMGYYPCGDTQNILGYAWKLWSEGRAVELLDPAINRSKHIDKALKYIQVALLCIEEDVADRPTINSVLSMLTSESCGLPSPKHPGFFFERILAMNGGRSQMSSMNEMTEITLEAR